MKKITQKDIDLPWKRWKKRALIVAAVKMTEPFEVETKEGVMQGKEGDYLVEGVEKELYPCDRDIFMKTYEEVDA